MTPVDNQLAQAIQRKVPVTVDLPLASGTYPVDSRLPRLLMDLGAMVTFKRDPALNYRGSYVVVDGHEFLYSAAPLGFSPPGALVRMLPGKRNEGAWTLPGGALPWRSGRECSGWPGKEPGSERVKESAA